MRCGLPCDREVPNVCMILPFCTLFAAGGVNILFCRTVGDIAKVAYPKQAATADEDRDSGDTSAHGRRSSGTGTGGYTDNSRINTTNHTNGTNAVLVTSHLVIPLHAPGTGNDTGIQYAEVVGSVDETAKSECVQYAQAVKVDVRGNLL